MNRFKNIVELSRKDIKGYLDNVSGYLMIVIFLGLVYYFFYQGFFNSGVASVREMFGLMPWFLAIFIPAITMGSFASEKEKQTIEYIITKPLKAIEIVLGKVWGASKFIILALLLTLPLPLFVSRLGAMDIGETLAGYIGTLLLALAYISLGVAISAFFKNQISVFIVTVVLLIILNIIGSEFVSYNLDTQTANLLAALSSTSHYFAITRGILDLQDILYFVSIILISNIITYVIIRNIRYNALKESLSTSVIATLAIAFFVMTIYYTAGASYGRLDITSSQKYTLSDVTKTILNRENKVIIDVYASEEMPFEYEFRLNELKNILKDYDRQGRDLLEVNYYNASEKEAELAKLQIAPVEFRTIGENNFEINQGYLAVVLRDENSEKQEIIPFVNNVDELEYDLSTKIYKIKTNDKIKAAIATGNGERSLQGDYNILNQIIANDIQLEEVTFPAVKTEEPTDPTLPETETLPTDEPAEDVKIPDLSGFNMLIIANPTNEYTEESKKAIKDYLSSGKNVLYMADTKDFNFNSPELQAIDPQSSFRGNLFSEEGVKITGDILYDLRSHLNLTVQTGNEAMPQIPYPYPPLMVSGKADSNKLASSPNTLAVPFGAKMELGEGWTVLYTTTPYAGTKSDTNFDPRQKYNEADLKEYPVIAVKKLNSGGELMVANTARIFDNQVISSYPDNIVLTSAVSDYLSDGIGFSDIRAKSINASRIAGISDADKQILRFGAPLLALVALGGVALYRTIKRRKLLAKYSNISA